MDLTVADLMVAMVADLIFEPGRKAERHVEETQMELL